MTCGLEVRCSIQLSYGRMIVVRVRMIMACQEEVNEARRFLAAASCGPPATDHFSSFLSSS